MSANYSDCFYCGGTVQEQRIDREVWWHGKLFLIEAAPVGACQQCGQKVVLPAVAKQIDQILSGQSPPDDLVEVPCYRFRESEPAV